MRILGIVALATPKCLSLLPSNPENSAQCDQKVECCDSRPTLPAEI
jgi:hypothetical protein